MVEHVEVLVEEPSMEVALRLLLPGMLGSTSFEVYRHQGKDDLLQHLPGRLRAYAQFLPDDWRILVVVDCDDDDCRSLKRRLDSIAEAAGLSTRSRAAGRAYSVSNRIAIEELEAWYFGDWAAVRAAYPRVAPGVPERAPYRDVDAIRGGTWEALERELQRGGYFRGGLAKIDAARSIAPRMNPAVNRSRSFQVLRDVVTEMGS
jgi:hypothetical protein